MHPIPLNKDFRVEARTLDSNEWAPVLAYATDVANANITKNEFDHHTVAVASIDLHPTSSVEIKVCYDKCAIATARVLPTILGVETRVQGNTITFKMSQVADVMLEINGDKWKALHLLMNEIDVNAPTSSTQDVWYFGPGLNNGQAFEKAVDGNITVPSNTSVYLASGAFVTAKFVFSGVQNSGIQGRGFICKDSVIHTNPCHSRELTGSAILIEHSNNIKVHGVTSLGARGFSLPVCQSKNIHIHRYRSFSSAGNGDGIDLFCCNNVVIENCFLRNSDDTIAIYGHRWNYHGDSSDIIIRNCVLLPDIAHGIHVGTHGNPEKPERISDIRIDNIDILDHCENQLWYQGCVSLNAGDSNLICDVDINNVRIEKITKGQMINIRVMKNAMWTTEPGRGVKNIAMRNLTLNMENSVAVHPSQILGYDATRQVENVRFENLRVGGNLIHEGSQKPRWYMVADLVPVFINEHVKNVEFLIAPGQ
ncbi:glycoside hydrolase family 28 protein [Aaosphaeria arxii CBS 175.79]|uniref:Glycoside hydrolase family 28 protein n=1 Tax=Aaosphaeria arxii CBS 175.79 TaxID=1450172 RepID=A0A6A5Y054_9PLEO|nr:glycoside hydrolase family 28 protein [Aaosphaeria arxii CBS 175.79]KAF2017944.1 glycoside hydrolase family 28 protein [Aaosphaeria arxii CBS 175.79]